MGSSVPPSSKTTAIRPPVIDIEASGFGKGSYPIEVGFVLPDGRSDCMLIRPMPEWSHWDRSAESLHRITRDALMRYGRPVVEVADRLNRQLEGTTIYSDNWAHDFSWLSVLYEAAGRRPWFRLESLMKLLSDDDLARWHVVKDEVFHESAPERHRASADARLLQATLVRLHARRRRVR